MKNTRISDFPFWSKTVVERVGGTEQETRQKLLLSEIELLSFEYTVRDLADGAIEMTPKRKFRLYSNSFVPQMTLSFAQTEVTVRFSPPRELRVLGRIFLAFVVLFLTAIAIIATNNGAYDVVGVLLLAVVGSCGFLFLCSFVTGLLAKKQLLQFLRG